MIIKWNKIGVGIVGQSPNLWQLYTTATLSQIQSPGFSAGQSLSDGDIIFASYTDGGTRKSSVFFANVSDGITDLVPSSGAGNLFNYENTFWLASNGSDSNPGTNQDQPFLTPAKVLSSLVPSAPFAVYKLNIVDAGVYDFTGFEIPGQVVLIIDAPGATATYNADVNDGFILNSGFSAIFANFLFIQQQASGPIIGAAINVSNNQSTALIGGDQIIGDIKRTNGNIYLNTITVDGSIDAGTGPGGIFCNVSFYSGTITNKDFIFGRLGQNYYGETTFNGTITGAYKPTILLTSPGSYVADLSWANAQIIVALSSGSATITLPQFSNVPFPQGTSFVVIQDSVGTFNFIVEGIDNLEQNLGSSSNAGDRAYVNRQGTTWYAGYITQATGGGAIDLISNLSGTGEGVFASTVGTNAQFKKVANTDGNIVITSDPNQVYLDIPDIIQEGDSLGAGTPVFDSKSGNTLNFNSLVEGDNITFDTTTPGEIKISSSAGGGDVTDAANVGTGIGLFRDKTMSILNFKSLIAGNFVTIDGADPDQVTISGTGAASFDYLNTYFLASNGSDSFSGKSIDQPKQTLNGASGVLNSIVNPTANNVLIILDGATYDQGGVVVDIPANMKLSIYGVSAAINSSGNDIFHVAANASLTLQLFQMQTTPGFNAVATTANGAYFNVLCNDIVGDISNIYNTQCQLFCNRALTGSIVSSNNATAGIRGVVIGQVGSITGNFQNEYFTLTPITYSSAQAILIDGNAIGRTIVLNSNGTGTYSIILPDKFTDYIGPGSYFYVFQAGTDRALFSTSGGAVLNSDKGTGTSYRTAVQGAMIRVQVSFIGNVTHWSISGQLTT